MTRAEGTTRARDAIRGAILMAMLLVGTLAGMFAFPTEAEGLVNPDYEVAARTYDLTEGEWVVFRQLHDQFVDTIYNGRTSAIFSFDPMYLYGVSDWTVADYGVEPVLADGSLNIDFANYVYPHLDESVSKILVALYGVSPEMTAWVCQGMGFPMDVDWVVNYYDDQWHLSFENGVVKIIVCKDCRGSNDYEIAPGVAQRIRDSMSTAQAIVNRHAGEPTYERLCSYRDEILSRSSYDHSKAALADRNGLFDPTLYDSTWQIMSVFDGDPSTKSVCESYSKAMKYLVDLTRESEGWDVECRDVTGEFTAPGVWGYHMWNVIEMPDGRNYLADITNSAAGTSGDDGCLFLVPAYGSPEVGYEVHTPGNETIRYEYIAETTDAYARSALVISTEGYARASEQPVQEVASDEGSQPVPAPSTIAEPIQEGEQADSAESGDSPIGEGQCLLPARNYVIEDPDNTVYIVLSTEGAEQEMSKTREANFLVAVIEASMLTDLLCAPLIAVLIRRDEMRARRRMTASSHTHRADVQQTIPAEGDGAGWSTAETTRLDWQVADTTRLGIYTAETTRMDRPTVLVGGQVA